MKTKLMAGLAGMLMAAAAFGAETEAPVLPEPGEEHAWLMQLVGEWSADVEMFKETGQPPEKSQGTESVRAIGGFWILAENRGIYMDKPFTGIMTLGFEPDKNQFVGTWVDSMTSHLWVYEGILDDARMVLTLKAEGPCPTAPGKLSKFKETIECKSADHRVFTSSMQGEDGKWTTMMIINYHRK